MSCVKAYHAEAAEPGKGRRVRAGRAPVFAVGAVAGPEEERSIFVREGDHAPLLVGVGDRQRVVGIDEAEKASRSPDVITDGIAVGIALDERTLQRVGVVGDEDVAADADAVAEGVVGESGRRGRRSSHIRLHSQRREAALRVVGGVEHGLAAACRVRHRAVAVIEERLRDGRCRAIVGDGRGDEPVRRVERVLGVALERRNGHRPRRHRVLESPSLDVAFDRPSGDLADAPRGQVSVGVVCERMRRAARRRSARLESKPVP